MNPSTFWALPAPFDVVAVGLAVLVQCVWLAAVRATRNMRSLGPAWPFAYWLLVYLTWQLGVGGARRMRLVRRGNDFREFNPEAGARWAGPGVTIIRWQVRTDATLSALATVVGFGGCLALLVVGVLWDWLLTIAAAALLWLAARARWLNRIAPWERP